MESAQIVDSSTTFGGAVDQVASSGFVRMKNLAAGDPLRARLREELICAYVPFARRLARQFAGRGQAVDDLTQVAVLGLINSVDRFDVDRGVPFSSFARPTITGELKRYFRDKGWSVHVQRRMQELYQEVNRAAIELPQRLGRSVTVSDIAARLNIEKSAVLAGLACGNAYATQSLNSPTSSDESGMEFGDTIGGPDERIESFADRHALHQLVGELPRREQRILALRFFDNLTQTQIAERVGISQMHVSRLLSRALGVLRERLLAEPV
jgi:RNA polymerase sigma-B factor